MTAETFHSVYKAITDTESGSFRPEKAARMFAQRVQREDLENDILQEIRKPIDHNFLYPDAITFLTYQFTRSSDPFTIWSQGEFVGYDGLPGYQLRKIKSVGINKSYRQRWIAMNAQHHMPRVIGGLDKNKVFKEYWLSRYTSDNSTVVHVIDDKLINIDSSLKVLAGRGIAGRGILVDRNGKYAKESYSPQANIRVVNSLENIHNLFDDANVVRWVDLDYTLLDHGAFRNHMAERVANLLKTSPQK